ncbi:WD repeat protein [Cordyceps militaris CM01]|uniref:WD repeat protein n=1 Tax=Cordyceps militaris (strain CM01) TaxID=983644 RepID=G3JPV9_CORMM|nr:WD repeat protein [Cordyceps militaris CM01]EGX89210.1 WD repeat protein [Cordyceps militaris CM01]
MSAVLPGKPQSRLQSLATGSWAKNHVNAYITGSALAILDDPHKVIQTVYDENDDELEAIAFDEASGKIAVCTTNSIRVYRPSARPEDPLKWTLEASFETPQAATGESFALSWGREEELLAASSSLSLYSTKSEIRCSWQKLLPNKAKVAALSYDSAYIASISDYDKLPKVWRRLAYGQDEVRFDHSYLSHPDVVTMVRWRKPFHVDQSATNVLYTFCLDGLVRIWTPTETADGQHWQLWEAININQFSGGPPSDPSRWIVCIVDGRDFMPCVEHLIQVRMSDDPTTDEVAMEHLIAVANKTPEICLAISRNGAMSAWALDNVGNNNAEGDRVFNIAQVKSPAFESLEDFINSSEMHHIEVQSYFDKKTGKLALLLHSFDGRIGVFYSDVANLFSPTTNDQRISLQTVWSGHSAAVVKINRSFSGRAVVSRTETGECIVWSHPEHRAVPSVALNRMSVITHDGGLHRVCVLRKGRFVVFLGTDSVSLWDCRPSKARMLAKCFAQWNGTALCLITLPRPDPPERTKAYISMITSERKGIVWEATLPAYSTGASVTASGRIVEFCRFELDVADGLKYVLPVDPAGKTPVASGFLDVFARDVAISYTRSGCVDFWTARVDLEKQRVDWLSTCCTETGMEDPALASGSTLKKAALINSSRSQLTIWDIGGSRLEFEEDYDAHSTIQDLDWTSTPDGQSILAVGFPYRVILLSQMRFDYLNKGPAWAQIRQISIRDLTPHPIGDSTWLGDGHLVIGAGNQLFVQDRLVSSDDANALDIRLPQRRDGVWDIFEAVQRFNGPLPLFHPQFLSQCVLSGKGVLVGRILKALHKALKYLVPGEPVDDYLGLDVTEIYEVTPKHAARPILRKGQVHYLNSDNDQDDDEEEPFKETTAASINEILKKVRIPQLSGHEQIQLMDMIECAAFVEKHRRSMDENGARFMLFFRQHALRKGRTSEIQLSWREIDWAYHSTTQDILVDFVARQTHGPMLWKHARESGLFMWITDVSALRAQFEVVARNEYANSESKSPVDCSFFYLALKKKTVLQGLWRMAAGNKEQIATQRLLLNNFEEDKWKIVAQKNAYALLGKRRFQYAAAFFLLAGRLCDAVEVCLRQLKDIQLAIAVARVYEGDGGPVLRKLLQDEVLPLAAREGDRWLASWAFWMLGRKDMAVRALITPVYTLLETPSSPDFRSRLFLTDDPALVVLYGQLRHKSLQTLRGASKVDPRVEWEFVLHSAKIYDRMGCDLLGLDLVRNWEFQQPSSAGIGGEFNPLKLLRRRSSLVVNDLPLVQLQTGVQGLAERGAKREAPPPTTFEEPDVGSLLDSFGL